MPDTRATSDPGELEKMEQLFLENMFHNIIFESLKTSFNAGPISREVSYCHKQLRLEGQTSRQCGVSSPLTVPVFSKLYAMFLGWSSNP